MVIADILKRWQVLLGNTDAQLLTGTDEHGMKVQGGYILFIEMWLMMMVRFNKLPSRLEWILRLFAT